MKITFITVGKIKKEFFKKAVEHYEKRLGNYCGFKSIEVKEDSYNAGAPLQEQLRKEAQRILDKIEDNAFSVALAENGKQASSRSLAEFLREFMMGAKGKKDVVFIVGGPYGLHQSVLEGADMTLSLSAMTLPHDLARLILTEQVYRAFTIIKGEPYSH